jgi:hypothetical protein
MAATTVFGEMQRQSNQRALSTGQVHNQVGFNIGKIIKVDLKRRLVQVAHMDGTIMFGNKTWIDLAHSTHDIVANWGTVRVGMEVVVFWQGNKGSPAIAKAIITGIEQETGPNTDFSENAMAQGFHNILMEPT